MDINRGAQTPLFIKSRSKRGGILHLKVSSMWHNMLLTSVCGLIPPSPSPQQFCRVVEVVSKDDFNKIWGQQNMN
jgi:hypothetical protein